MSFKELFIEMYSTVQCITRKKISDGIFLMNLKQLSTPLLPIYKGYKLVQKNAYFSKHWDSSLKSYDKRWTD